MIKNLICFVLCVLLNVGAYAIVPLIRNDFFERLVISMVFLILYLLLKGEAMRSKSLVLGLVYLLAVNLSLWIGKGSVFELWIDVR